MSSKRYGLLIIRDHLSSPSPRFFSGVHVVHLLINFFLCCPIMCLYVLSAMLWCLLRFPHTNDVRFMMSNICCVVFLLCLSSFCVSYVAGFSGLLIVDCPFGVLEVEHLFITCLHVCSSVWWCPLRFPRKNVVGMVLTPICYVGGSCYVDVICIYLRMLMSNNDIHIR